MQNVRQCRDEKLLDLAVALFGDLVERLALGLGAPDNAHNQGNKKNDAHDNSCGEEAGRVRGNVAHDGANAHERPNAQSATNQEEHDALRAAAIARREQLGTPQSVEALSGETCGNAPQDYVYPKNPAHGFGVATLDSKAEYGNSNPRQQRQQRRGTEQHAVGDNVAEAAEDCQRADGKQ